MKCKNCCGEEFNEECTETAKGCKKCHMFLNCKCPKKNFCEHLTVKNIRIGGLKYNKQAICKKHHIGVFIDKLDPYSWKDVKNKMCGECNNEN